MARIVITGSADGLGRATADTLLREGHEVVVHTRSRERLAVLTDLLDRGALSVVGDLADERETRDVADQVNRFGRMDAVVHNAGVYTGAAILPVNVVAPYLLTALIERPERLIYLSSGMHRGGRADLAALDWSGAPVPAPTPTASSSSPSCPRRWPDSGRACIATPSTRGGCPRGWAVRTLLTTSASAPSPRSGSQ